MNLVLLCDMPFRFTIRSIRRLILKVQESLKKTLFISPRLEAETKPSNSNLIFAFLDPIYAGINGLSLGLLGIFTCNKKRKKSQLHPYLLFISSHEGQPIDCPEYMSPANSYSYSRKSMT